MCTRARVCVFLDTKSTQEQENHLKSIRIYLELDMGEYYIPGVRYYIDTDIRFGSGVCGLKRTHTRTPKTLKEKTP